MTERIEGRNAIAEALRSGQRLERVFIAKGMRQDPLVDEIVERAKQTGIPVVHVDRAELDRASERGHHQGVAANMPDFAYANLRTVLDACASKERSLIIVLDHVTDPGNFGAVLRSAEVAGADAVIVADRRSAPVTAVVHKAAAGATAYLPVVRVTNLTQTLKGLQEARYWVAGASERGATTLWEAPLEGRIVLVLGSEGSGLSRLVSENCDFLVQIPVAGKVGSLNVAQAATVFAFEWVRRGTGA